MDLGPDMSEDEKRVRVLIEKKTVLNLVDAFCVAVKHYLRGEPGRIDLYPKGIYDVQ
jgi:putative membrane protein